MEQMPKKETIIYGGAFNPPTLAHEAILRACVGYASEHGAEVWVMPSGDRFDKTIPTERATRLAYVAAMLEGLDGVKVDTSELDRPVEVETYDTVVELEQSHPDRQFTFVFGADSTQTMGTWKGGNELLKNLPMLVVEREGSEISPLAEKAVRLPVVAPNTSSTEVRNRLTRGEAVDGLVSEAVKRVLAQSACVLEDEVA